MYNHGRGEVITKTEYLRWKFRNDQKVFLNIFLKIFQCEMGVKCALKLSLKQEKVRICEHDHQNELYTAFICFFVELVCFSIDQEI